MVLHKLSNKANNSEFLRRIKCKQTHFPNQEYLFTTSAPVSDKRGPQFRKPKPFRLVCKQD